MGHLALNYYNSDSEVYPVASDGAWLLLNCEGTVYSYDAALVRRLSRFLATQPQYFFLCSSKA